jgi:SHAQKYF class myb-like DNA-binding protein
VSAVFDVGLKHSSPSSLLEQMPPHEQITTERIKSHLQKYRLHRQKSKKEFMANYESTLLKMKSGELDLDPSNMNCGEVAAHLTYSTINEQEVTSVDPSSLVQGGVLQLPQLTEEEKRSPVGASMGYLMGLFFSLKQQLQIQREGKYPDGDGSAITPSTSPQPSLELPSDRTQSTYYSSGWKTTSATAAGIDFHTPGHTQMDFASAHASSSAAAASSSSLHANQYQQSYYQGFPAHQHATSSSSASGPLMTSASNLPPEARSSNVMEESNMMKRDMKSQMAFQNKMRKLKEQELSKYTQATESISDINAANTSSVPMKSDYIMNHTSSSGDGAMKNETDAMAMGGSDFWGSEEVLDEKLFEFLMND